MAEKINRVMVYVDGFNLYFGMVDAGLPHCKWLDINKLIADSITSNQQGFKQPSKTKKANHLPGSFGNNRDKNNLWLV